MNGKVASSQITQEAVGGNRVQLTVDSEFQRGLQGVLEDMMQYLRDLNDPAYDEVSAGALVVLDVKSNAVLGMATAPT